MSHEVPRIAVVGASGFIGQEISAALLAHGCLVEKLVAPRLSTKARTVHELEIELGSSSDVAALRECFGGVQVVINAAGMSDATSQAKDHLFGANSLLPLVLHEAAQQAGVPRFIHISSAAVQGRRLLDESRTVAPFSPYSLSKALADLSLFDWPTVCIYRPTSVHGPGRTVTRKLSRVAQSALSSVVGSGDQPTPQVLVEDVARAVAWCALFPGALPTVVLQPWSGMTTARVLEILSGRRPRRLPVFLAQLVLGTARVVALVQPQHLASVRRLEMLWFGQQQAPGWLTRQDLTMQSTDASWAEMAARFRGDGAAV